MCRSNNKETSYKFNSVPFNLAFNINNDQIESIDTSHLHINDHLALDQYLDTLVGDRNLNSMNNNSTENTTNTIFGYPMPVDLFSAFVASAVAAGGIVGYCKAGSKPSLVAGLVFGGLLGVGTYFTSTNPNQSSSYYLTLGSSSVLGLVMGIRFLKSGKFMPAGLISSLATALVIKSAYQMFTIKDDKGI